MAPQDQFITSLQKDSLTFLPPRRYFGQGLCRFLQKIPGNVRPRSIKDSHAFWLEQAAQELQWFKKPAKTLEYTWDSQKRVIQHTWFADGELNVSVNCLDRHLNGPNQQKTAILWQGEKDEEVRRITYAELHEMVCRFANVLLSKGIKAKGDRVCIYMPMVPRGGMATLLACAPTGRDPLGGVRRVFRGIYQGPHPGFPERGRHHRRRGFPGG